jgi:Leucine-rich repeat (LRR) protein
MKTKILLTLLFLVAINLFSFSQVFEKQGAGVTIIVHGWNPDGSQPAWMDKMADAIIARGGGNGIKVNITVTGSKGALTATCSNWNYDVTTATSAEMVVLVNWTAVSNHLTTGVTAQEVAAALAPKIYQSQNGKPALAELPIHLIGHSRGGGMVFEIARLLGIQGVEVDHVTALDPHPLTASDPQGVAQPIGPGSTIDTPIKIYDNILFADNYWQNISYPKGQSLTGAYNRLWTSLPGGYHNETGYTYNILGTNYNFSDHLNTILAYHGTINLATPANNGQATMTTAERAWFNTFENTGQKSGFVYSLTIAGDRKSTDTPNSGDAVIGGYHNNSKLGGSGARVTLDMSGSVWPNLFSIKIELNGSALNVGNTYSVGGSDQLQVTNNPFRSYSKDGTCYFYLDNDRNPYNGAYLQDNTSFPATAENIQSQNFFYTTPSQLMDGYYYALFEMNDGTNIRYIYAPYRFYRECIISTNDENFRSALLAIPGLDANSDGDIQCSEAAAWTGTIDVSGKSITDLTGIENFTKITTLNCSNNQLSSLDISKNTTLQNINFNGNLFTSIDLSKNTALTHIYCQGNRLVNLDISKNTSITYIDCSNNALQLLNVKNGNNTNFTYFDARTNTKLTCIEVDNVTYSTTNWTNKDAGASYNTTCSVCEVSIPDANFKTALLNNSEININGDGMIECYEAAAFTGEISVSGNSIADMTGIEAFTNITKLYCGNNSFTTLNVSSNTALQTLFCNDLALTSLNVTGLTALKELGCYNNLLTTLNVTGLSSLTNLDCSTNKFTSLDFSGKGLSSLSELYCNDNLLTSLNVSGLSSLTNLNCSNNKFESLDFSGKNLSSLSYLYCNDNLLTSLNVSGLTALSEFECYNNQITSLDISTNSNLYSVNCEHNSLTSLLTGSISLFQMWCGYNSLTSLNVSQNLSLANLYCYYNSLTSLDISSNQSFSYFECNNNSLTLLNVKNGNNINFNSFNATNNPALTCIQVDDAAWSTTNWTNKDATASFNTNCGYNIYTIAASVSPTGSGTIAGAGTYNAGTTVTLTATPATGYSFTNWTESATPVSTNATYSFTATANRTLVANFTQNTGIENIFDNSSITIFPNPNNGRFTIGLNNRYNGEITIIINSVIGNQLKLGRFNKFTKEMIYPIETENLAKGIYMVKIQTATYYVVKMVIIE